MERLFFVKQFLKPTLIAADKNIKDVRFNSGVNGDFITVEHEGLYSNINIDVTDLNCTNIMREVLKHI